MLKIPRKMSVGLSLTLAVVFMVALLFGAAVMPGLADMLIDTRNAMDAARQIAEKDRISILILAYAVLAVGALADAMLFFLLLRVRGGLVFSARSVALIRGVSWCAIVLGCLFAVLGLYFRMALIVAFAGIFLGLCVRVVKNVIEEAVAIKSEHDLTV